MASRVDGLVQAMSDDSLQPCPYCGEPDKLWANVFFTAPVCGVCFRVWREWYPLTKEELAAKSRELRKEKKHVPN